MSETSRYYPYLGKKASDSRSRIMGINLFIPFPFSNFGNAFFHSLPVPEFGIAFFSFPSRPRILGMVFFRSLPIPELRKWSYPFPFLFPTLKSHSRSPVKIQAPGLFYFEMPSPLPALPHFCWVVKLPLSFYVSFQG